MTLKKNLKRTFGKKATRRIYAAMPWVGGVAAVALGVAVQRRGVRNVLNSVQDLPSSVGNAVRRAESYVRDRDDELVGSR